MLLAIDAGNTNIVFAICDGQHIKAQWRCASKVERTDDELGILLHNFFTFSRISSETVTAIIIVTVVPTLTLMLQNLCRRYFNIEPMLIGDSKINIKINIENQNKLGYDRIVTSFAARHLYQSFNQPIMIIDFGTVTTFDFLNRNGDHIGGIIIPGLNMSLQALHMASSQLPMITLKKSYKIIGKNTIEAMQSGLYWGYISMIEGLIYRIAKEQDTDVNDITVVSTGGLALYFTKAIDEIQYLHNDLTILGLLMIYHINKK